jgi:hypothetical protein
MRVFLALRVLLYTAILTGAAIHFIGSGDSAAGPGHSVSGRTSQGRAASMSYIGARPTALHLDWLAHCVDGIPWGPIEINYWGSDLSARGSRIENSGRRDVTRDDGARGRATVRLSATLHGGRGAAGTFEVTAVFQTRIGAIACGTGPIRWSVGRAPRAAPPPAP